MAAIAQIVIQVDDQGAVTAVRQLNAETQKLEPSLQKVGQRGNVVLTGLTKQHQQARDAAALLGNTLGVQLPRQVETFLSKSRLIGPALATAFNVSIVLAMGAALIALIPKIKDISQELGGLTEDLREMKKAAIAASNAARLDFATPQAGREQLATTRAIIEGLNLQRDALTKFFDKLALVPGVPAKLVQLAIDKIKKLSSTIAENQKLLEDQEKRLGTVTLDEQNKVFDAAQKTAQLRVAIVAASGNEIKAIEAQAAVERVRIEFGLFQELGKGAKRNVEVIAALQQQLVLTQKKAAADVLAVERKKADELRKLQNELNQVGLGQFALIQERLRAAKEEVDLRRDLNGLEKERLKLLLDQRAAGEEGELSRKIAVEGSRAILEAEAQSVSGRERLEREYLATLARITQEEIDLSRGKEGEILELTAKRTAAQIGHERALSEMRRQNAEETLRIEEDAALATLPPWQQSYGQIALEAARRLREIELALARTEISSGDAARRSAAVWQEEFARTRDQLAGDLESLFDDITSGNIGKRFLAQFKKLVFQMIATWILGLGQMRAASAGGLGGGAGGGGGILGGILGAIFGGGGSGQAGAGGGFGLPGTGPGGTAPTFPGGIFGGTGAGGGISTNLFPGGSNLFPTAGGTGNLGVIGSVLSAGGGVTQGTILPAGATGPGGAGGIAGVLAKLFPRGAGGLSIGGLKISQTQFAALGIGLLASSVGRGGILGALGGAAGGASLGFAVGGPIGAVIGAIVGLFAGLIRGSTRKKRLEIERIVKEQARKVEEDFKFFQIDFSQARDQLEQIRQQGVEALRSAGVKDISRSRVGHVDHWVDQALQSITAIQARRLERAEILERFPLPEFQAGGLVRAIHGQGGKLLAFLHDGEAVLNRAAVARLGPQRVQQINRGGESPGQPIVVNIAPGAVVVNASPGMDEQAVAELAIRQLLRELADRGRPLL